VESVASNILNKRMAMRAAVVERLKGAVAEAAAGGGLRNSLKDTASVAAWWRGGGGRGGRGGGGGEDGGEDGTRGTGGVRKVDDAKESKAVIEPVLASHGVWPGREGFLTLGRLETLMAENIDRVALIFFPITYAVYTASVFG
jgi:hypothetical protein